MRRIALVLTIVLGGCSTLRAYTPTMGADASEIGFEGLVLQNELMKAYVQEKRTGDDRLCSRIAPSFQERGKFSYTRFEQGRDGSRHAQLTEDQFECVTFRTFASPAEQTAAVRAHVESGFALSDLYCDNFFRRISQNMSQRNFARGTTNDVGAAISAILGLAAAGSGVTGGVGAGFGLLDGAFRNYDENFLVTPDLPGVQKLVKRHQNDLRTAVGKAMPTNYPDATMRILEYANLCSFTGMKGLLNESVQTAAERGDGSGAVEERMAEFAAASERRSAQAEEAKLKEVQRTLKAVEDRKALEKKLEELNAPPPQGSSGANPQP